MRVPVQAPIEKALTAFSTRRGIESWFLRESVFTRKEKILSEDEAVIPGDEYTWRWFGWHDDVVERGTILDTTQKDLLAFSFGKAGNVSINISPEENISMVTLQQTEIPTDEESVVKFHLGCMQGWLCYLTNLKSILEGGIDLRNRDLALKNVLNS